MRSLFPLYLPLYRLVCDPHRIRKIALERKKKNPNSPGCIVYSIGSNGNFMFELALQVRGDDFIDVLSHS